MRRFDLLLAFCLSVVPVLAAAQAEAPSWVQFAQSKMVGKMGESVLLDFSYAGYQFSDQPIPDVSTWNTIDVTDHGAVADDEGFDDDAIQAAIDAAEASGVPTVVFFPAGRYKIADTAHASTPIVIDGSHIVLKGAGAGDGGTEIYADQFGDFSWRFHFRPEAVDESTITIITEGITRGDFQIEVASTANLAVGQLVDLHQHTTDNLPLNISHSEYKSVWRLPNNGIRPYEKHLITHLEGKTVTFKNPVNLHFAPHLSSSRVRRYTTIEEVGVEGILFTSGWINRPEEYGHHDSDLEDYAYRALAFENVSNGWVRDCEFRDWNESLMIEKCMAVTVRDCLFSGKQGHTSYFTRYSYGILFEHCIDDVVMAPGSRHGHAGQIHGPGMRWSTTSSVFLNCKMNKHQSIDCHGYHPYGNLLDGVYGGTIRGNGGAENSYPNSGPDLTFWNFQHDSNYSSKLFDFWDPVNRKTHTYADPKFIGFKNGPGENITFANEALNELYDQDVYPQSLFEAQLQLRRFGGYMSASSSAEDHPARLANDGDTTTAWSSAGPGEGAWLMLDLGVVQRVEEISIQEVGAIIDGFVLEYWDESEWQVIASESGIGAERNFALSDAIETRKLRLRVLGLFEGDAGLPISIHTFRASKDRSEYAETIRVQRATTSEVTLTWEEHPLAGENETAEVSQSTTLMKWEASEGEHFKIGNRTLWTAAMPTAGTALFYRLQLPD